jgi:GTP cyclohydrolase IA
MIEAEHLCMTWRGGRAAHARTSASTMRGLLRSDSRSRRAFVSLAHGGSV